MRPSFWLAVCLASIVVTPSMVQAQDGVLGNFSATRFRPAPGPLNYMGTDGTSIGGHLTPSAGLILDYSYAPLTLYDATCAPDDPTDCETTGVNRRLVSHMFQQHIIGSIALFDRLQVGLDFPLGYVTGEGIDVDIMGMRRIVGGIDEYTIGDPQLSVKGRIWGDGRDGIGIAARYWLTFPIAHNMATGSFMGDPTVTTGGEIIGEYSIEGFHLALNLGGYWREKQQVFSTVGTSQLTYRVAAAYDVTPLVTVLAELDGASTFETQVDENPLEGRLTGQLKQGDFNFSLGVGTGFISGVGVPVVRVFGGVTWAPLRYDTDGDGILDDDDACPAEMEDMDGYIDDDGCPEPDNDNDGFLDADDSCPNEAEDRDDNEDEDGCPDPDNDGDGINDGYDSCPEVPEDMDGDRDEDGCPDDDTDRDGIPDADDQCPNDPEDTDGFGDEDGCPEEDFDGDGIPDDNDVCPDEPEVMNGVEDDDGCPEEDSDGDGIPDAVDRCPEEAETMNGRRDDDGCPDGDALVVVEGQTIRLMQQVQFATNRATIRGRRSRQILDAVATILQRNPNYRRVRVEGHTDNRGPADRNRELSMDRAQACVEYLVEKGIATERLYAQGFGPDRPLEDNETREGRAANRRVEFHIEPVAPGTENQVEADATGEVPEGEAGEEEGGEEATE
jgi:outer membrane protein OmpA-like peptidoglycan-associated protein